MKYTVNEFAQEIRKMYPGDYDDLSDGKLVDLWLQKYPSDREKINFNTNDKIKSENSEKSTTSFLPVMWISVIAVLIFLVKNFVNSNNSSRTQQVEQNTNNNYSSSQSGQGTTGSNTHNYSNNITITPEAENEVDSNFNKFNLSRDDLNTLKQILSDPNPDPENKNGTNCGLMTKKCEWCGRDFDVQQQYITVKKLIGYIDNPFSGLVIAFGTALGKENKLGSELHEMCVKFREGDKYKCDDYNSSNYCSEKCEHEYKNR